MAHLKDLIVTGAGRFVDKVYASEFVGKLTGNADTATKATKDGSGNTITSTYATISAVNGKAPTSHASTATTYGAASASNYGHAMASSTTPKANGTAAVGSETAKFARGDHVHPLQTSVSGSAGSVAWSGVTSKPSYYDAKAIKSITRSGTTFTYTCMDGTTGTFTQQDNNTTYSAGNGLSLSSGAFSVSYGTSASALGTSSAGTATTVSRSDHVHALPALTSCTGTLTVAKGGTGATKAEDARTNLNVPSRTGSGASGSWGISITGSSASCTGNAATATKATQDASGNVITSTYLKLNGNNLMTPAANGNLVASDASGSWIKDDQFGLCSIGRGNGDGATIGASGTANIFIKSWYGVGFVDANSGGKVAVAINCRTGNVLASNFTGSGANLTSLNAGNITYGTLGIANGGTGATSRSGARTNLGISSGTSLPSSGSTGDIFFLYS